MFIVVVPSVEKQEHYEIFFFSLASFCSERSSDYQFLQSQKSHIRDGKFIYIIIIIYICKPSYRKDFV